MLSNLGLNLKTMTRYHVNHMITHRTRPRPRLYALPTDHAVSMNQQTDHTVDIDIQKRANEPLGTFDM